MWRRITDEGLRNAYLNNEDIRKMLKLPQVLSFVPVEDVVTIFKKIKLDNSNCQDERIINFYQYFEDNYVGREVEVEKEVRGRYNRKRNQIVKKWKDPLFPIKMWNVHSRVKDGLSRSTNFCEAWHNAFSSTLCKHPLFYALVDALRKEQKKTETEILKLETGIVHKRKSKYILLDERIQNIFSHYSIAKFDEFYENLSLILKY